MQQSTRDLCADGSKISVTIQSSANVMQRVQFPRSRLGTEIREANELQISNANGKCAASKRSQIKC